MLKLRQRLIPYLYSLFEECHRTGAPILRPLLFEYPADETTYTADDEFMLGEALLVAPVTQRGIEHRHVYLPEGTWFHLWTDQRVHGPNHLLAHAPLGAPPVYVRANLPVPLWPEMNHVRERPPDPLTLLVYPAEGEGESRLYEDAGDGFEHERGDYAHTRIGCRTEQGVTSLEIGAREGAFQPQRRNLEVELRGLVSRPVEVRLQGKPVTGWRQENGTVTVRLEDSPRAQLLEVRQTP